MKTKIPIRITQKPTQAKTYKAPRVLSLEATGLLYNVLINSDSDGNYTWGKSKTAEHFGIHYNQLKAPFEELHRKGYLTTVQDGRDPKTGRRLLYIVRPTGRAQRPCTSVCVEAHLENKDTSATETQKQASIPKSMHACEHLSVITQSTDSRSVSMGCNNVGTEDGMHARVHGAADPKKLQSALDEEQSELRFWLATKNTKNVETCRQRIAELAAQLGRPDGGAQ
jgi:hypothetical protein